MKIMDWIIKIIACLSVYVLGGLLVYNLGRKHKTKEDRRICLISYILGILFMNVLTFLEKLFVR